MEKNKQVINGFRITQALASDYIIIYYVDLNTGEFIEYSASDTFKGLGIETDGEDFFVVSHRNARRLIHPDDLETFTSTITRERLIEALRESNARNESSGGAVIACGMARYQCDRSVSAVFDRADERMYENKKDLKLSF